MLVLSSGFQLFFSFTYLIMLLSQAVKRITEIMVAAFQQVKRHHPQHRCRQTPSARPPVAVVCPLPSLTTGIPF